MHLYIIDIVGTFVFAISGFLVAAKERFDWFGAFVVAFVTATGGGTLRDILLGSLPVGWIVSELYVYLIIGAVCFTMLFKRYIVRLHRTLFFFDSLGIGAFTVLGVQKALNMGVSPIIAIIMGTVSAVFGGIVRDVLTNRQPLIFREEIYATPCIFGAIFYLIFEPFGWNSYVLTSSAALLVFAIRVLAVKNKWSMPTVRLD